MIIQSFLLHKYALEMPRRETLNKFRVRAMHALVARADALESATNCDEILEAEPVRAGRVTQRMHAETQPHTGQLRWLDDGRQHDCHRCKWHNGKRSRANVQCDRCNEYFCHKRGQDCFTAQHEATVWHQVKRKRQNDL